MGANSKPDFGGYATKNNILCEDGRVIRHNAFASCDGKTVPIVWSHKHSSVMNVLGHALLENREDGVYCYGYLNDTEEGIHAKKSIQHGDVNSLSIFANKLRQNGADVVHGVIREVSLCLAGANEGAIIDTVEMAHDVDGDVEIAEIRFGEMMELDIDSEEPISHAAKEEEKEMAEETKKEPEEQAKEEGKTVKEIYDSMTDDQKKVCAFLVGAAKESVDEDSDEEEEEEVKHNLFDIEQENNDEQLMHDALNTMMEDAKRSNSSLRETYLKHAAEYGIDNIEWLFPEHKNIADGAPAFIKRTPDEWVDIVMNGVKHSPFSRIKMMFADLREDDARAKGYAQKGKLKKEEVFGLIKRTVDPTTVYKKQKLDRDDVIDITDFDVVSWIKGEMRLMLDEEIARAIIFGDGRAAADEDKIREDKIIPICKDDDFYALKKEIEVAQGQELGDALIDGCVMALDDYEGSGNTTLFISNKMITKMLLLKDTLGHRFYKTKAELALAMNVNRIVAVPESIIPADVYGVIVDLKDYNVGADKGGSVNMFDDFDIDYNQMKYLMETRCSGALTKPFSAIVLKVKANG